MGIFSAENLKTFRFRERNVREGKGKGGRKEG